MKEVRESAVKSKSGRTSGSNLAGQWNLKAAGFTLAVEFLSNFTWLSREIFYQQKANSPLLLVLYGHVSQLVPRNGKTNILAGGIDWHAVGNEFFDHRCNFKSRRVIEWKIGKGEEGKEFFQR